MKLTGVCPKCRSTDIRTKTGRMWPNMIPLGRTVFGAAYSQWFVCSSCGFVEMWVADEKDFLRIRKKLPARQD